MHQCIISNHTTFIASFGENLWKPVYLLIYLMGIIGSLHHVEFEISRWHKTAFVLPFAKQCLTGVLDSLQRSCVLNLMPIERIVSELDKKMFRLLTHCGTDEGLHTRGELLKNHALRDIREWRCIVGGRGARIFGHAVCNSHNAWCVGR
jgi:hypothetical protein